MGSLDILNQIHVASPCPAQWSEMKGDTHARFCGQCERHVYNLSVMTSEEAASLVSQTEGRLCVRFYRRRDGTMLTADCPEGARIGRRRRLVRVASAAALGLTSLFGGTLMMAQATGESEASYGGVVQDWMERLKMWLGLTPRPMAVAGRMAVTGGDFMGSIGESASPPAQCLTPLPTPNSTEGSDAEPVVPNDIADSQAGGQEPAPADNSRPIN